MEAQVRRIKNILRSEFFTVNDSWLTECIEYYVSQHDNPPDNEVYEFVKSQWLLSDLRKINSENGCLPRNLADTMSTVLPGTYILQMNKMYDIATSKYKQLQEIRSVSTINIEATEEQHEPGWIPKKRRTLQMYLTDGVQDVIAIEYKPMPSLNSMLLPGYKVMIIGPVNCRRGVIFLENKNFKEVGGEEESLLICNALENVLARALGMEENPDPYNDSKQTKEQQNQSTVADQDPFGEDFDVDIVSTVVEPDVMGIAQESTGTKQNQKTKTKTGINQSNRLAPQASKPRSNKSKKKTERKINDFIVHDNDVIELSDSDEFNMPTTSTGSSGNYGKNEEFKRKGFSYSAGRNTSTQEENKGKIKSAIVDNLEFPDDDFDLLDFDVVSTNVENKSTDISAGQRQSSTKSNQFSVTGNKTHQSPSNAFGSTAKSPFNNDDFPDDDFDFDDFDVVPTHTSKKTQDSGVISKGSITQTDTASTSIIGNICNAQSKPSSSYSDRSKPCPVAMSKLSIRNSPSRNPSSSGIASKSIKSKIITSTEDDFPDDDFDFEDFKVMPKKEENRSELSSASNKKVEKSSANNSLSNKKLTNTLEEASSLSSALNKKAIKNEEESLGSNSPLSWKTTKSSTGHTILESNESYVSSVRKNLEEKGRVLLHGNVTNTVNTFPITSGGKRAAISPPTVSPQKMRRLQETPKQMKTNSTAGKSAKISDFFQKISPIAVPPKICDFISDFVDETVTDIVFKTVRAQITAMGKLSKKDSSWLLEGTITDGTACLEITFASELLEKVLGFTTTEFSQRKKLKKTNPEIDKELRMVFRNAELQLKNLDALVELQLRPNEKARALSIRELTDKQKEAIDKRLNMLRM